MICQLLPYGHFWFRILIWGYACTFRNEVSFTALCPELETIGIGISKPILFALHGSVLSKWKNSVMSRCFSMLCFPFLKTQWNSIVWKRSNVLLSFIQGGGRDLSWERVSRPQKCQISRLSGYQNWGSWSLVRTDPQLLSTDSSLNFKIPSTVSQT